MTKESFSFPSHDDVGTAIHGVKWMPDDGRLVAVLQMVHGMVEYIERYEELAEFLCARGFVVVGHDHIGHGLSVADESELGIMHTRYPADVMVEDMYTVYTMIHGTYPTLPQFIMGHSMGSFLLRKFLIEKSREIPDLDGAIIMGTGSMSGLAMDGGLLVVNAIARMKGWDYRSKLAAGMMYGDAYKQFDITRKDPANSWLSKDVEKVREFQSDPKTDFIFSLNGYKLLLLTCKLVEKKKHLRKMRMDIPILFISGSDDPVGDLGRGVKRAAAAFHAAGVMDLSLKLFAGDRHEIINETDRDQVFNYIFHWINKRIKK